MKHRHLIYPSDSAIEELPLPALLDTLDRGDLADWKPIADAIWRDPNSPFAERILQLIEAHPMYGTTSLWREWIARLRDRARASTAPRTRTSLAALRQRAGLTQAELALQVGMSQSDLSKFERRGDVRLSSLRSYILGLGGSLRLVAFVEGAAVDIDIG